MSDTRSSWQRHVGVGERQITSPTARLPHKVTAVRSDDGPFRGSVVGAQREHKDGRIDAHATIHSTQANPLLTARKVPHDSI